MAAWKLNAGRVAIVIGKTIHLHNASKKELVDNTRWLRHEIAHIKQSREHGHFLFILKYLWESLKSGYRNNKFEIMAREAEQDETICNDVTVV